MIGIAVHSRSCRQTSMPSPSGSTRSMIAACGGRTAALSSASAAVDGRVDLEAGVAQDHPQRAQDLRLVVADQDALVRAHVPEAVASGTGSSRRSSSAGNSTTKLVPWPGSDSTDTRPPLASTNPRTIASPRPGAAVAGARAAGAVERLEDAVALGRRDPGPAVDDADEQPPAGHARRGPRRGARPSSARRSRAGWRTPARAGPRRRARAAGRGRATSEKRSGGSRRSSIAALMTSSIEHHCGPRVGGAALEPREVEQVVDQARQPRALGGDHAAELAPLLVA